MEKTLRMVLEAAYKESDFAVTTFFRLWFDEHGLPLYFLFRKNLSVTNMQLVELTGLLRTYISDRRTGKRKRQLLFLTTRDFKAAISDIFTESLSSTRTLQERFSLLIDLYSDLLGRMVVFDPFHGSAAVFLPPNLDIDLRRVCSLSGYVHSCGHAIFIRQIDKVDQHHMIEALERHLRRFEPDGRLFLAAYSHEDFSRFDRRRELRLKHGLDDVKIYIEKHFVGGERLPKVLASLQERFQGKLFVPPAGDFKTAHAQNRSEIGVDPKRSAWLLVDSPMISQGRRERRRLLICYNQVYRNVCPFQIFGENKPAWVAHTTISHSLMRAMLNATLPWSEGSVAITDPFVGTGTALLEAQKFKDAQVLCSDLDPAARILCRDNLEVFTLQVDELEQMSTRLDSLASAVGLPDTQETRTSVSDEIDSQEGILEDDLQWALGLLEQQFSAEDTVNSGSVFRKDVLQEIVNANLAKRLLIYIAMRAQLRYSGAFSRQSTDLASAMSREAAVLSEQIRELISLKKNSSVIFDEESRFLSFQDDYSIGLTFTLKVLEGVDVDEVGIHDCRELPDESFDVIVADPPYGFNTSDSEEALATLYREMISSFVRALRDDGQLVFCLPDQAFTGQRLPTCTRADLVIHQVLVEAENNEREVILLGHALPAHGDLFRPPYYWQSERALSRKILHFRLRKKMG